MKTIPCAIVAACFVAAVGLTGCGQTKTPPAKAEVGLGDEVATERSKLSPEDRELVNAQDLCVSTEEPLGSMGAPIKLSIKGQPVFVCCASCKFKDEADPEKTLAKLEELKAKKAKK